MQQRYVKTSSYCISNFIMESRESCLAADDRAWKVDGRAQALVGPGLATPLIIRYLYFTLKTFLFKTCL